MRKGYLAEYQAKQKLAQEYGKENVIKVAIGGATDYIIVSGSQIVKIVEVKSAKKKWYPKPREKIQIQRIIDFARRHNIKAELWLKEGKKWSILPLFPFLFSSLAQNKA